MGKSTYFLLLKNTLETEDYKVIHPNFENFLGASLQSLMQTLTYELEKIEKPLYPDLFGQFLHTIRNLYHSRQEHCLKSVIFLGLSNIVGVVEDNASPFNISDNLNMPFFTTEETSELLGQHEHETGQLFEHKVKKKIGEITANQPGLVNGFAAELVKRSKGKPVIDYEKYLEVEHWYLRKAIDKNVANIVSKAKKHRRFLEGLLFREAKVSFNVNREEIKFLYVNGIIDEDQDHNVTFKVPLYRKAMHDAFYPYMNGEKDRMGGEIWAKEYFQEEGSLEMAKLVARCKSWVQRRSFKYFREKDKAGKYISLKEAALIYSFETFMQAFLEVAGGKSYLEAHTGLGRSDLIINVLGREYIIEFKVYRNSAQFLDGKPQLVYYCKKMGLKEGTCLVFVPVHLKTPPPVMESEEEMEGVTLTTWLIP